MLPESLMIVEDEVLTRRFLQSVAEKLGIRVIGTCDNGAALLQMLKDTRPEMILMDINIKGAVDGLQTVRLIAQSRRPVPIVFITAYTDGDTLAEAMSLSPYGFVAKPATPKQLEIALNLACVRSRASGKAADILLLPEGFTYHVEAGMLSQGGDAIRLSKRERLLLALLAKAPRQPVAFSALETALWPLALPGPDALPSLIKRFRQKTSKNLIVNLYGDGYALNLL